MHWVYDGWILRHLFSNDVYSLLLIKVFHWMISHRFARCYYEDLISWIKFFCIWKRVQVVHVLSSHISGRAMYLDKSVTIAIYVGSWQCITYIWDLFFVTFIDDFIGYNYAFLWNKRLNALRNLNNLRMKWKNNLVRVLRSSKMIDKVNIWVLNSKNT